MARPMNEADAILEFWFGEGFEDLADSTIAGRQSKLWWGKDEAADAGIRNQFEAQVRAAGTGKLDDWKASPDGWLALILLVDQFPRNIYRNTPDMFRFDGAAREYCEQGLDAGIDQRLRPIQRVFFYLPLEHSESPEDQTRCVALMEALVDQADAAEKKVFEGFVGYADAHKRIIDRFGRFPHRNRILGRDSSAEEVEFLAQPGSSF